MNVILKSIFVFCASAILSNQFAKAVMIQTVPVGFPGNGSDASTGSLYGSVPYNYRIGTFDVTIAQYVKFLNAKAGVSDPFGLWNIHMDASRIVASYVEAGAIYRTGSGPFTYSVKPGYANKPIVYISWYEAVRFVNWLQNGQGNGDTESGTYTITGGGNNSGTVTIPTAAQRAAWANTNSFHWLLPSENEWYKAAYYNGTNGTYFAYPFQNDSQPVGEIPPGDANSGNFYNNGYVAHGYDGTISYLTDVGSYTNARSPFSAYDMGGEAFQWMDTQVGGSLVLRGGTWEFDSRASGSVYRGTDGPTPEYGDRGFRLASVPEPSSLFLVAVGGIVIAGMRLGQHRRSHASRNHGVSCNNCASKRNAIRCQ